MHPGQGYIAFRIFNMGKCRMEKITPLFDRLLVSEVTKTNDSNIYIPPSGKERSLIMHVDSTGPEVKQITQGQTILIAKYAGIETSVGTKKSYLIRECDVLATIQEII